MADEDTVDQESPDAKARHIADAEELIKLTDSKGWKVLLERNAEEAHIALLDLINVDPFKGEEVRNLQDKVKRLNWYIETPDEMIRSALEPEKIEDLENDEGTD